MVELIMKNQVLFYCAGVTIFLGIIVKLITGISLKRLVKAASNISKSNHTLMRLVRAKFEHACMISDKVQNVQAFVEKYLYEYKVLGIRLYAWRNMEKSLIILCAVFCVAGGVISYYIEHDVIKTQNYAVIGGAGVAFLFLLQVAGSESGKLSAVKMYMVDFLENTYAHRYERMSRTVIDERESVPENEVIVEPEYREEEEVVPVKEPEIQPQQQPRRTPAPQVEPELQPVQAAKIREILEEFLA